MEEREVVEGRREVMEEGVEGQTVSGTKLCSVLSSQSPEPSLISVTKLNDCSLRSSSSTYA